MPAPECVAAVGRHEARDGERDPALPHEEPHRHRSEQQAGEKGETADGIDGRGVVAEQHGEQRGGLGLPPPGEPRDAAADGEQQHAARERALDHAQPLDEVCRICRVIKGRRAARDEHAGVAAHGFARALQPRADARERARRQREERELAPRTEQRDEAVVGVVPQEDEAGEQDDDADAREPVGAEPQLDGFGGGCRDRRRCDLRCGLLLRQGLRRWRDGDRRRLRRLYRRCLRQGWRRDRRGLRCQPTGEQCEAVVEFLHEPSHARLILPESFEFQTFCGVHGRGDCQRRVMAANG